MLQLTENKRTRHTQIAKKFKNGLPLFRSFLAASIAARTPAVNTSARAVNWSFARLDATLLSALSARDIRHRLRAREKR
jgi:hypothetical protein